MPAQTFFYELFGTLLVVLHWWEESHTQTIGLCRQTVQKSSVDRRHADLHRFHVGLCEAPQPQTVAQVALDLMSNDANHGQFRRLSAPCWRLAATSCKRLPHMKRSWFFFFWVSQRTRQDWPRGWTRTWVKPSRWTNTRHLWSQCTCPLLHHTPLFVMDDSELAADLWFWSVLCVVDLSLLMTVSPYSSRSNTSLWASRNVLIATSPIASRHTTDSPSSSILHTYMCLATWKMTFPFTTESILVEASWNVVDCNCMRRQRQISTSLVLLRCQHGLRVPEVPGQRPTLPTSVVKTLANWEYRPKNTLQYSCVDRSTVGHPTEEIDEARIRLEPSA